MMPHRRPWVVLFACLLLAGPAWAAEWIQDYDVLIKVQDDASLEVTENITVTAEGNNIRRGIYRDFPTRYRDRFNNAVVVDLEVLGVERDGQPEPWFTERMSNGVRINTGNDDLLPVPATYRYSIRYRTTRQLGFFADHDELYFNAIGHGWMFPIRAGRVKVHLPSPVPVEQMRAEAYVGAAGERGRAFTVETPLPGVAQWALTAPLMPNQGMTIVLSFPKGLVPEPTTSQRMAWLLKDNRGVLIALLGLVLMLAYCVQRWMKVGRDPSKGVVIARYQPMQGWSPAAMRYLVERGLDARCFTAEVLSLAVKGHVRIERDPGRRKDGWTIARAVLPIGAEGPALAESERALLDSLLPSPKSTLVLKPSNAPVLQAAQSQQRENFEKAFEKRYYHRNLGSVGKAALIAGLAVGAAFFFSGGVGLPAISVLTGLMIVVLVLFVWLIEAPTPAGRKVLDEIEGLKLYLSVAERDELAGLKGPDAPPTLDAGHYERLLPYAVALGVEDAWTKKFTLAVGAAAAAAATGAIAWYSGGGMKDLGSLSKAVGGGLSSAIASASSPPGSSSGSGGGGSSGGGGGGGGGGGR